MTDHLYEERRPVNLIDDASYDLVTVKRGRGGVIKRETKLGRDISVKTQFRVCDGDFLISKRQIVHGACGIVPRDLDGSTVSNEYSVLRGHGTIDLEFLKYLSHSIYFQQTCFHSSIGVHIEKMIFKLDRWLSWNFDLPPIQEQSKIAKVLSTWDQAVDATGKLIEATQLQKLALMAKLLTPPSDADSAGSNPQWEKKTFGDLGSFFSGVTYSPADVTDSSGLLVLRSSNVQDGQIAFDNNVFVQPSVKVTTTTRIGDVVICVRNGSRSLIGKTAQISDNSIGLAHGAFMSLFRPNEEADFCGHLFNTPRFHKLVGQNLGATINSINTSNLRDYAFVLPPKSHWRRIGQVLSSHDRVLDALKAQHANLKIQRMSLMQQLLTGKRRVHVTSSARERASA